MPAPGKAANDEAASEMRERTPSEAVNIRNRGSRKDTNDESSEVSGKPSSRPPQRRASKSQGGEAPTELPRSASDEASVSSSEAAVGADKSGRRWGLRTSRSNIGVEEPPSADGPAKPGVAKGYMRSSSSSSSMSSMSSTPSLTGMFDLPVRGWGLRKNTKPSFGGAAAEELAFDESAGTELVEDDEYEEEGDDDEEEEEEEEYEPPQKRDFKGPHVVVTGGQGFIGSHTTLRLLEEGYVVTVLDSGVNSHSDAIDRVRALVTEEQAGHLFSHKLDLCDMVSLKATFAAVASIKRIDSCVHLASLNPTGSPDKSTRESTRYHQNNVVGTMNLLSVLAQHGCRKVVFSSSAMVYGDKPHGSPLREADSQAVVGGQCANPYARGKSYVESIMEDMCLSPLEGGAWGMVSLRYYNAVGAHPSGRIGEDPTVCPANNSMRELLQVMLGKRPELVVNGDGYDTVDGTCVRDYVHVMDLAEGHLCAVKKLANSTTAAGGKVAGLTGFHCFNLGLQAGVSDLQLVAAMEAATGLKVKVKVGKQRAGDVAEAFVDPSKAWAELEWKATREITEVCKDVWAWARQNPDGYVGRDLKQTFGQFKAPSFKKSSMPKLSSEGRPKARKKKDKSVEALEGLKRLDTMDEYEAAMGAAF
mmetsp:Transcript_69642/g.131074  ORF Transcript_69642/g.131074 Transcript_69642/m.131074 type:complete len:645 (-) Transcript_69642:202-2136(-)